MYLLEHHICMTNLFYPDRPQHPRQLTGDQTKSCMTSFIERSGVLSHSRHRVKNNMIHDFVNMISSLKCSSIKHGFCSSIRALCVRPSDMILTWGVCSALSFCIRYSHGATVGRVTLGLVSLRFLQDYLV